MAFCQRKSLKELSLLVCVYVCAVHFTFTVESTLDVIITPEAHVTYRQPWELRIEIVFIIFIAYT